MKRKQKHAAKAPIGELLTKLGVIDSEELCAVPGLEGSLSSRKAALGLAAGPRERLGELLTHAHVLIEQQIQHALEEQRKTGEKLGAVLVRLGHLTLAERDVLVQFQRHQGGEVPTCDLLRLGHILVETGEITQSQLDEALLRKTQTGRRVGEELVAEGCLTRERLERALSRQRRLVSIAIVAALWAATPAKMREAKAAQMKATMSVTATVVETTSIRPIHQTQDLVITAQDVARGYVEVPAASHFEIRNRGSCVFEFRATSSFFRSVTVRAQDAAVELGRDGGTLVQKSAGGAASNVVLGYRFELERDVSPGSYRWPLLLTVLPM